jgi:anti-sigma28 factor (negative regulator of flagellin synthesis)
MKITDKPNPVGLNVSPGQRKYDSVVEQAPKVGPRGVQIDIKAAELSQPFDIDEKLVAAIRQQLQGGEFEIDYDAVAESVLQNAMAFSGRTPITSK